MKSTDTAKRQDVVDALEHEEAVYCERAWCTVSVLGVAAWTLPMKRSLPMQPMHTRQRVLQ